MLPAGIPHKFTMYIQFMIFNLLSLSYYRRYQPLDSAMKTARGNYVSVRLTSVHRNSQGSRLLPVSAGWTNLPMQVSSRNQKMILLSARKSCGMNPRAKQAGREFVDRETPQAPNDEAIKPLTYHSNGDFSTQSLVSR